MSQSSNFKKLSSELADIFSNAEFELEARHSLDVLNWVKIIDPNASESLQIAALAHDLDRGIAPMIRKIDEETYDEYKERHAKRSSELIAQLMTKYNFPQSTIKRTVSLVKNHEVGGDDEADILMDADSISFFSCNIDWYYHYKNENLESTTDGIKYKFERATPRAQKIIREVVIKNKILRDVCNEIFNRIDVVMST